MNQTALANIIKYFENKVGRKIIDAETQSLIYAFVRGESYMSTKFNEADVKIIEEIKQYKLEGDTS